MPTPAFHCPATVPFTLYAHELTVGGAPATVPLTYTVGNPLFVSVAPAADGMSCVFTCLNPATPVAVTASVDGKTAAPYNLHASATIVFDADPNALASVALSDTP